MNERQFLRHTVATLAYRGGKAMRDLPAGVANLKAGETTRTPLQILGHINDLLDWALSMAKGAQAWNDSNPEVWQKEVDRFFAGLQRLDHYLASEGPLGVSCEKLFQGPIADALTHVGQIAILRRIGSAPVRAENYAKADIVTGRVGLEQAAPRREFD